MAELTGGELIVETLKAHGVDTVFGIVSVHNLPIFDAIDQLGGITPIQVRHEQAAVHAADAYARSTGRLGVAIASTGPGAANTVPGLFEAGFASSRVLMITGQIDTPYYGKGKGFLHEAERQIPMLRTICRKVESVRRTADISETLADVIADILTGRPQPGALEVPIDLQFGKTDCPVVVRDATPVAPAADAVTRAAEMLAGAERPVIWAGGGVVSARATDELVALAEKLGAPVVTTTTGRGAIPEDHPNAIGASPDRAAMRSVFDKADVMLAVGTRFGAQITGTWQAAIPSTLIHLDVDPTVINLNYPATESLVGDAKLGLAALAAAVSTTAADGTLLEHARAVRDTDVEAIREQMGPGHQVVMDTMRELLPRSAPIVRDATVPAYLWGNRLMPIYEAGTSMHPTSAAIGPGLPLGIGAAVASGEPTVVIQGDGGLMLSIGELATVAQYGLPLILCIFNDKGYGVLRRIQDRTFGRRTVVDLATPDFVALAASMNVAAEAVPDADAFRPAFTAALERGGPTVLDIDMNGLGELQLWPAARN